MPFVAFIIKQCMSDMLKMSSDRCVLPVSSLHCTGHITESFQYLIVRYSMLPMTTIFINRHLHTIFKMSPDMSSDGPFIFFYIAPYKSPIQSFSCSVKNCFARKLNAYSFFAITNSPEVSLSIRWTRPTRSKSDLSPFCSK